MDREIKFRAWFSGIPAMVEFGLGENNIDVYDSLDDKFTVDINNADSIMQYTGLKDRNGKEIYEGDVVFVDCSSVAGSFEDGTYKVEYVVPDCMFALIQMDNKNGIAFNECYIYEVIGNVHSNPELL